MGCMLKLLCDNNMRTYPNLQVTYWRYFRIRYDDIVISFLYIMTLFTILDPFTLDYWVRWDMFSSQALTGNSTLTVILKIKMLKNQTDMPLSPQ